MPEPDLLSSLQPPTLQSVMAPMDTLGQVGVGLSGIGREQNPALVEAQGQFKQQLELMQVRQATERLRMEKTRLLQTIADEMLKSPDLSTRDFGGQVKGNILKELGLNPSPSVLAGLATRSIPEGDMQRAGRYLDLFNGDVKRTAELSGLPLQVVQELSQGRQSDAYSRTVYGKSLAQRKKEAVDLEKSEYELWQKKHPLTPDVAAEASLLASEKFPKQTLESLVDDDRNAVARLAQKNVTSREIEKEKRKFAEQIELAKVKANLAQLKTHIENQQVATLATHGIRLLDPKGNEYAGDPLALSGDVISQGYEPVKDNMAKDLRAGKQSFRIFGNMRAQAAVLAQKGLLAKTAALYDQVAQQSPDYAAAQGGDPGAMERLATYVAFNIGKFTKDPDVLTWAGMESEMIISLRNLGEKGVRAMQGFAGAVGVMKGGQYDAVDRYIRNLELITVAQFDKKWERSFETRYIGKHRKSGTTGSLVLRPGEPLDLGQYQITPEFGLPPQ